MNNSHIKPGNIFCTENPMWLGRSISAIQKFWSVDNEATYSHAGIIETSGGETFESLWTIKRSHINKYLGKRILIGESNIPIQTQLDALYKVVKDHQGQWYPFWRLGFHLLPPLAKYISSGKFPVCSELVVKKEIQSGVKIWGKRWQGKNPDHVADAIRKWKGVYTVVYEGVWDGI
jgi:hypothetical protein